MPNYFMLPGIRETLNLPLLTERYKESHVISVVCKYFDVPESYVMSHSRLQRYVMPRHIIMYYLTEKAKMSLTNVGKLFNRDHTTIIHAKNAVITQLRMSFDNDYKTHVNALNSIL